VLDRAAVQSAVFGAVSVAAVPTAFGATLPPHTPAELPVTERPPPLAPVLSSTIPIPALPAAVPASILRKVSPLAPIVVFWTVSAVADVVAIVFAEPVTLTVPPPVAENAALAAVLSVSVPPNEIVDPVLLLSETPAPEVTLRVPP
jgi:hypothetical protein